MVPNVAGTGTSFKGAALYYLHDKRQEGEAERLTSDRVAWSETRNLSTDDPELAWRIMAATAMDQDRLKAEAGIKATGRKSDASVYAYSIAWHPDEAATLSRAEMVRAAEESIRALGAQDRQAILIAHRDEPHPHVHVMLNRVSPVDGRMLGTSNDFKKLDAWALAYRRERGEEHKYCPARAEKDAARRRQRSGEQAEFVRGDKTTPRAMEADYSAAQAANDNSAKRERDRQKALNQKLAADSKQMHGRHRQEWSELSTRYRAKKAEIIARAGDAIERSRESVKELYRPSWRDLYRRQDQERRRFTERETRLGGKIENALSAIAHRRELDPENSRGFLSAAMNFLTSGAARTAALEKLHGLQQRELARQQKRELDRAVAAVKKNRSALLDRARAGFGTDRAALIGRQGAEREEARRAWEQRRQETRRAFEAIVRERDASHNAKREQTVAEKLAQARGRAAFNDASQAQRRTRSKDRERDRGRGDD